MLCSIWWCLKMFLFFHPFLWASNSFILVSCTQVYLNRGVSLVSLVHVHPVVFWPPIWTCFLTHMCDFLLCLFLLRSVIGGHLVISPCMFLLSICVIWPPILYLFFVIYWINDNFPSFMCFVLVLKPKKLVRPLGG